MAAALENEKIIEEWGKEEVVKKAVKGRWCQFGDKCRRRECNFLHTNLPVCRFGFRCRNTKCERLHPFQRINKPCNYGVDCTRKICRFVHPIAKPCKFGEECKKDGCLYRHSDKSVSEEDQSNDVAVQEASEDVAQEEVVAEQ